jgi:hypothetical protein
MPEGVGRAALTLGSRHLFLVHLLIGIVIFRMTQLILIVDRAYRCLILTRMFIVSVIVIIFGATRRVRGENQSLKMARGEYFWVCSDHARILVKIRESQVGPFELVSA